MATIVYKNAYIWINGVDYSSDTAELSLNYTAEMLDETAMGDNTRIHKGGLKDWTAGCTFHQDFAAGHIGSGLWDLVGTTTCIEMRPNNSCTTATNPSFSGICILDGLPPMTGTVGQLLDTKINFVSASDLSRASSS